MTVFGAGHIAGIRLQPLHDLQRWEQLADLVGQIGVFVDVFLDRRPLAGRCRSANSSANSSIGSRCDSVCSMAVTPRNAS